MHSKLENDNVLRWTLNHDIVFLYELRTNCPFSVPGFHVFTADDNRTGGTGVLISNALMNSVRKIDLSMNNLCWLELVDQPELVILGCYFPPPDSPYYSPEIIAQLQNRIIHTGLKCLLVGDFNARCAVEPALVKLFLPQ